MFQSAESMEVFEQLFTKCFHRKIDFTCTKKEYLDLFAPVQEPPYKGMQHISFDALKKMSGNIQILACLVAGTRLFVS